MISGAEGGIGTVRPAGSSRACSSCDCACHGAELLDCFSADDVASTGGAADAFDCDLFALAARSATTAADCAALPLLALLTVSVLGACAAAFAPFPTAVCGAPVPATTLGSTDAPFFAAGGVFSSDA